MAQAAGSITTGDATGGIIPYKNPAALIAYYCGIFSIFPILGLLCGIPGIVLGIIGLRQRRANPIIKGSIHAWIGIVMGSLTTLLWGGLLLLMVIAIAASPRPH
jgi:hypothetical protein